MDKVKTLSIFLMYLLVKASGLNNNNLRYAGFTF